MACTEAQHSTAQHSTAQHSINAATLVLKGVCPCVPPPVRRQGTSGAAQRFQGSLFQGSLFQGSRFQGSLLC